MSTATTAWLDSLFSAIDAMDTSAFVGHLTPDAEFRFGNLPAVHGAEAIAAMVGGFFQGIRGLRHTLHAHWSSGDAVICHGMVTYTRHDGSELTVPFANIMRRDGERAGDYRIFADVSALFAPAA
jgi:limonene-1,2-epoxide hydrolase